MPSPLLSICIPTYNRARFLARSLDRMVAQIPDDGSVEIVVSDNGSPDETRQVLDAMQARSRWIRCSSTSANVGGALNFRRVLELARGEYCLWMGDDDLLADGAIAYYLSAIRANERCDWFLVNYIVGPQDAIADIARTRKPSVRGSAVGLPRAKELRFADFRSVFIGDYDVSIEMLCAMFACIFRRRLVTTVFATISADLCVIGNDKLDGSLYTYEALFPHMRCWLDALTDAPGALLPEPYYLQGLGVSIENEAGLENSIDTVFQNIWMWVYPQLIRHIARRLHLGGAARRKVLSQLELRCLRELQGRAMRRSLSFTSWRQAMDYLWSVRSLMYAHPLEAVKILKNTMPMPVVSAISRLRRACCGGHGTPETAGSSSSLM